MIHHLSIARATRSMSQGSWPSSWAVSRSRFRPSGELLCASARRARIGCRGLSGGNRAHPGGSEGGGFVKKPAAERGYGPTHFALSVNAEADAVEAIAKREGWQCLRCNRGPFHVIEVWIENESMVEILPPEFAAEYLAFTRPDKVAAAKAGAPTQRSRGMSRPLLKM